jgi:hypothetical protein
MGIELREQSLVSRLEQLARAQANTAEEVLESAVRDYLDRIDEQIIHNETEAFWAMQNVLLEKYPGEHVAIHRGEVIDHDRDVKRLEARVRSKFGLLPLLIAPVKSGARSNLTWRGVRTDSSP